MIMVWLLILLTGGGLLAWVAGRWSPTWSRWISVLATVLGLLLAAGAALSPSPWPLQWQRDWIPQFGIGFSLAMDGLSYLLVLLTLVLGLVAIIASWTEVRTQVGLFHLFLLWNLVGVLGVFLAADLILFFFFWEMMLIPMYFLIALWGHEGRARAAVKFFIFTQASGLLLLLGILGLYVVHGRSTGVYTFAYKDLLGTSLTARESMLFMLGFLAAFAVKLPVVPFHTWLPDAHTEAPTAGSIVLAGLLLKTGGYGMIRFVLPLFPAAVQTIRPLAMVLGVVGIIYGAVLAYAQSDLKRMIAYTSVSHLGFVFLGVFAGNAPALQGAVMQMLCHGLGTGALFALVGIIQARLHTRDLDHLGGLWTVAPRLSATGLFFAMAALGLPGLGNFVGEFLVLLGTYRQSVTLAVWAALGLVAATIYAVTLVQRAFHGPTPRLSAFSDLTRREVCVMGGLALLLVWLGLFPQPVLDVAAPTVAALTATGGGP